MKNPLIFQTSEYDCGPTTLLNAMRYLFDREQILPELIKSISLYTLDVYNKDGEYGKSGTSRMAMMFLSNWFNQFGVTKNYPIHTEMLLDENVVINANSKITECLQQGGAVILCVWLGECKHYLLLTDVEGDYLCLFDPYEWDHPIDGDGILKVEGQPKKMNRKVRMDRMNSISQEFYALGSIKEREAMLVYNTDTRMSPEKSIEYFI